MNNRIITFNVLIKKEDNLYIAHCLELDIVTTSDDVRITLGMDSSLVAGKANIETTTAAMASLARCKMNADIGIGIDGYTELIDNVMTVKMFTAIDNQRNEQLVVRNYSGRNKQVIISRAAYSALFDLKKLLAST